MKLELKPTPMTPEVMQMLEDKGLIIRLCPSHHAFELQSEDCETKDIYVSDEKYGPHKIIVVVVDRTAFTAFGTHPDNEEFLLIGGDPAEKKMYLLVALCKKEEFEAKVRENRLTAEDLVCLDCKYNDPEVSFFTMLKDVPHGEATKDEPKKPASFYVTEPNDMGLDAVDFGAYDIVIDD